MLKIFNAYREDEIDLESKHPETMKLINKIYIKELHMLYNPVFEEIKKKV
jgi:hypothetical protein